MRMELTKSEQIALGNCGYKGNNGPITTLGELLDKIPINVQFHRPQNGEKITLDLIILPKLILHEDKRTVSKIWIAEYRKGDFKIGWHNVELIVALYELALIYAKNPYMVSITCLESYEHGK